MRHLVNFIVSTKTMVVLLTIFAISIGWATFIENDFGTDGARSIIYNAKWFEILLILSAINLIAIIFKYRLYRKEKITMFLFHLAFVIIILGAGITRYFGKEGYMHIREGQKTSTWYSSENFIKVQIRNENQIINKNYPVLFSSVSRNKFKKHFQFGNKLFEISLLKFIPQAEKELISSPDGKAFLHLVKNENNQREDLFLGDDNEASVQGISIKLLDVGEPVTENAICFKRTEDGELQFISPVNFVKMSMGNQSVDTLISNEWHSFERMTVYYINNTPLVLKEFLSSAIINPLPVENKNANLPSALIFEVKYDNAVKNLIVWGEKESYGSPELYNMGDFQLTLSYGSLSYELPFELALNDFIFKRYPGSQSPSWFESDVTLNDPEKGKISPYRIYMNHTLKHRGYRFFQASYDMDEKGTVLSVNHDLAGTTVSYIGYILMTLGMALSLINKSSWYRSGGIKKLEFNGKATLLIGIITIFSLNSYSQDSIQNNQHQLPVINKEHARLFGRVLVQDNGGRIEPINTLSSEILRKVAREDRYKGQSPDQVLLGMIVFPEIWQNEPLIRISNDDIAKAIGLKSKYASYSDFITEDRKGYLLQKYVDEAYRKKPGYRSKFDNEIIRIDERFNICYLVYSGNLLKIFPNRADSAMKWHSSVDANTAFKGDDSIFVNLIMPYYAEEVNKSVLSGDWKMPDQILSSINKFQTANSQNIIPESFKIKAEYFYNQVNIFNRLAPIYLILGFILLIIQFIYVFSSQIRINYFAIGTIIVIVGLFIFHTVGLALRWYIAGHAPWSNGYEALVFIAWVTILAGILFAKRSGITISATAILAGLVLLTAHMSWMDPQVTNLAPVLKSYWLIIHVAVIISSYGFVGLGALLAIINLLFMILQHSNNRQKLEYQIALITNIIEKTLIVGLYMLTIGCFLGAVWANESWGRYWGWDPKETWALITILVYAIVVHVRLVPGLTGRLLFNILSLIAFGTVLMTYFGVNYYLSGMHSYAKGDPLPVPPVIYYSIAAVIILSISAVYNQNKLFKSLK